MIAIILKFLNVDLIRLLLKFPIHLMPFTSPNLLPFTIISTIARSPRNLYELELMIFMIFHVKTFNTTHRALFNTAFLATKH